jgi:NitT/TauT family transport system permease protein
MVRSDTRRVQFAAVATSLVICAAVWEIVGRRSSNAFMAPLSATLLRLWEILQSGEMARQGKESLALFVSGFGVALLVGMPAGLVLARSRTLRVALESYIMILNATPMVALIPFILSMMGFGFAPKVLVVFLFAVFPILFNTVEGARTIKPELIEVARSFRSGEWALWRDVMVPYTLAFTMTGIRQATGRALVGMVAAEFFLSSSGLGQTIMLSSQNFDTATLLATILVIGLVGVFLMEAGRMLENRLAAWRGYSR